MRNFIILVLFKVVLSSNEIPVGAKFPVVFNKCCKAGEIIFGNVCKEANDSLSWSPNFLVNKRVGDIQVHVVSGFPNCAEKSHLWPVFDSYSDRLRFLLDGTLRHYIVKDAEVLDEDLKDEKFYIDYKEGTYCSDRKIETKTTEQKETYFALLCVPEVTTSWNDADFIMRKIVNPIFHVTSLICYVMVAYIHFVLPQLRDLFGNIVATINICMALAQAADIARIFTDIGHPLTNLIADVALCVSVLAGYFWLTALGFYLWKTFRSTNVFLRMTHGKKYCCYSFCVWSATILMTLVALLAHFFLDNNLDSDSSNLMKIGMLVIAIFYLPIACCLILNIFFYQTTSSYMKVYGRYGRIHHKFKICVDIFGRLQLAMSVYWAFLAVTWLPYDGIYYTYVIVNGLIAPLILYISVLSQRRVRFLLRKECCFEKCFCHCLRPNQPDDVPEWGEEMMAIYR